MYFFMGLIMGVAGFQLVTLAWQKKFVRCVPYVLTLIIMGITLYHAYAVQPDRINLESEAYQNEEEAS